MKRFSRHLQSLLAEPASTTYDPPDGAHKTIVTNPFPYSGWHLMGTARMELDLDQSVVDP